MAGIRIPKTLKNFNAHIDGVGYAGVIVEGQLPSIEVKTEEHRAGGMDMPREIDMGLNKLECSFTLGEINAAVMNQVAIFNGSNTEVKLYGALNDDETTAAIPVIAIMRGKITKVEPKGWKAGDPSEEKYTMSLKFYSLSVDGGEVYYIDNDNLVRRINGSDQMESIRAAIRL